MTGWEPATEAEVAMRDALRAQDQQLYFRILTRVDLLLPVSAQGLAGQAPTGWGTWTTGGRTHVLAFTSVTAMRACLGENAGATRRVPYADLAAGWPNHEWWLAVNPGLPIEGYLPAWFVAQLSRGDVRLPGRTMGARARLERVENAARARTETDATGRDMPTAPVSAGPPAAAVPASPGFPAAAPAAAFAPAPATPAGPASPSAGSAAPTAGSPASGSASPSSGRASAAGATSPSAGRASAASFAPAGRASAAPVPPAAGGSAPDPAVESATVQLPPAPSPPARPAAPSGAGSPLPPIPRRPEPNGFLAANRLGPHGRRAEDEPGARDAWPGQANGAPAAAPPADRAAVDRSASGSDPGGDSLSGWLSDLRRRPDEPDAFGGAGRSGSPPGRSGEPAPPRPARSFFEPSGQSSRRPSPLDPSQRTGERAAPPSRFAGGGQPFPRRRPLSEPVPEDPTRAFRTDGGETTPALRPAEEPTRPFRPVPPPAAGEEATQSLPRRRPQPPDAPGAAAPDAGERTQPIPPAPGDAGFGVPAEAEELPPSIAEPVSGPPASRRGFSPIVIEGTIIESRDLTEPEEPAPARPVPGPAPVVPEPYAVPTVPAASSALAGATAPPEYRGESAGPAGPWAGSAEPTVPLAVEPLAQRVDAGAPAPYGERPAEPVRPSGESSFAPPAPVERAEPDPADGGRDRSVASLFEPIEPPAEATMPLFDRITAPAEQTQLLFPPAPPVEEQPQLLFPPAPPVEEQTQPLFPPAPPVEERTQLLFPPAPPVEERTESLFPPAPPTGERTESLFPPAPPAGERTGSTATDEPAGSLFEPPAPAQPGSASAGEPTGSPTAPTAPPAGPAAGATSRVDGTPAAPGPVPADFVPANEVEEELLAAVSSGSTDGFLTTLLLARVLLPVAADSGPASRPGEAGFVWRTEQLDGGTYVVVYTSPERLADRADGPVETVRVKFVQLIRRWPDENWSFAVNPGSPVGATYPGEQVLALANWAAEVGLGDEPEGEPERPAAEAEPAAAGRPAPPPVDRTRPVTMQKVIAPSQLAYYLERGYDRVSGFVHRANELAHLRTPTELYDALGLGHPGSPFSRDAEEIYVLRWPVYRPSLYRIPYGGQNEAAMRAMEGWVIERPPFRGNGFAPGETSDVVAEFKVDSARLPHGAELCRIGADGTERVVAVLDTDALLWRRVDAA